MHLNIALFTHFDKQSECLHITLNIANLFHISGSGVRSGVLVDLVSTCLPGVVSLLTQFLLVFQGLGVSMQWCNSSNAVYLRTVP